MADNPAKGTSVKDERGEEYLAREGFRFFAILQIILLLLLLILLLLFILLLLLLLLLLLPLLSVHAQW